jgi:hypothetical protein
MKQLFFLTAGVLTLTLCSFAVSGGKGVTRVGEHLFEVKRSAAFTVNDRAQLKDAIKGYYSINGMGTCEGNEITLMAQGSGECSGSSVETKFAEGILDYRATKWDCSSVASNNVHIETMDRILSNYAAMQ